MVLGRKLLLLKQERAEMSIRNVLLSLVEVEAEVEIQNEVEAVDFDSELEYIHNQEDAKENGLVVERKRLLHI